MKINVHAGHNPDGKVAGGAVGLVKESTVAREIKDEVIGKLRLLGHVVYDCTVDDGTSQEDVLEKIVSKCNAHTVDLDVSIHLNFGRNDPSGDGSVGGVEVYTFDKLSARAVSAAEGICESLSSLGFTNRGVKQNPALYVLKYTNAQAVLIETFFADDADDASLYKKYGPEGIGEKIVQGITGQSSGQAVTQGQVATRPSQSAGKPDIRYGVKLATGRTLPEVKNDSDYAGNEGQQIVGFQCRLSDGTPVRYRAHTVKGTWLPWVTGCDWNDFKNGFAGNNRNAIDAVEIKCDSHEILYKASSVEGGASYYGTVSSRTVSGNSSFAGVMGKPIDKVMCWMG